MSKSFVILFFFSSRRRHTRFDCDWSSDVCSSDLDEACPAHHLQWIGVTKAKPGADPLACPNRGRGQGQCEQAVAEPVQRLVDRKSTRLNSSHSQISYAVFCLK